VTKAPKRWRSLGAVEVLVKPFEPMTMPDKLRAIWAHCTA
jgi:hypothetical protein